MPRSAATDRGEMIMKLPLAGGCLCGAIRYEISAEPRGPLRQLKRLARRIGRRVLPAFIHFRPRRARWRACGRTRSWQ
jgi:hypothetical protein